MPEEALPAPFFVAGGTVPPGSPSYVERAADRELLEALLAGEFCHVLNSRQMGKSSLAVRTIARLNEAGVRTAFVDLTRLGATGADPERWYAGLLAETGRALGLRAEAMAYLKANAALPAVARLFAFLRDVALGTPPSGGEGAGGEGNIVLMVDEIDAVRSLPFPADDLFAGLRELWNARATDPAVSRLAVCLLGAALPSDLIADPRRTPFNVGRRIELRDLAPEEARPFAAALSASPLPSGGEGQGVRGKGSAAAQTLARVLHWTGGHPFLTQALCAALAGTPPSGEGQGWGPERRVNALVRARYLDARARETDTNLTDVGRRLLGEGDPNVDDKARAETLALYERILKGKPVADDEANPSAARIKMSGVARVENGNLKVRNHIYAAAFDARWVRDNMPGGELRRQRRAFWKGALRSGLIGTAVAATIAALAVRAEISAGRAQRAEVEANRQKGIAQANATDAHREADDARTQRGIAQSRAVEAGHERDAATKARDAATVARNAEAKTAASLRVALQTQKSLSDKATRAARLADEQRALALAQKGIAQGNAAEAKRQKGRAEDQTRLVLKNEAALKDELYENVIESLPALSALGDREAVVEALDSVAWRKDRGWEWGYWHRLSAARTLATLPPDATPNAPSGTQTVFFPEGFDGFGVRQGGAARLVDGRTGRTVRELWRIPQPKLGFRILASFSHNGRWAIRDDGAKGRVLQDVVGGSIRPLPPTADLVADGAVSDDGGRYVTYSVSADGTGTVYRFTVWDVASGRPLFVRTPPAPLGRLQDLAPDGRSVFLSYRAESQGRLGIAEYDFERDRVSTVYALPVSPGPTGVTLVYPFFGPDGALGIQINDRLAFFRRGDPAPRHVDPILRTAGVSFFQASTSRDGLLLLSPQRFVGGSVFGGLAQVYDLRTGRLLGTPLADGTLSGDGRTIVSASAGVLRIVDWRQNLPYEDVDLLAALPRPTTEPRTPAATTQGDRVEFADGGTFLVQRGVPSRRRYGASNEDGYDHPSSLVRVDRRGRVLARYPAQGDVPAGEQATWNGSHLFVRKGPWLEIRRPADFGLLRTIRLDDLPLPDVDESGRHAASVDARGVLHAWADGPTPVASAPTDFPASDSMSLFPMLSPDGTEVLLQSNGRVKAWSMKDLRLVADLATSAQFGTYWESDRSIGLYTATGRAVSYDLATRRQTPVPPASGSGRYLGPHSPDGRLYASLSVEPIEIRSVHSERKLFSLDIKPNDTSVGRRFTDDGHAFEVLYASGTLRVYRDDHGCLPPPAHG